MGTHSAKPDAIREWILATARGGHDIDAIVGMMLRSGYERRQARQLVAKALDRPGLAVEVSTARSDGLRPRHPEPPALELDGRRIEVSLCVETPTIRLLEALLDDSECEALIELARPRLDRSLTVDTAGQHTVNTTRTSSGMFFALGETPLVARIEQRIAALTELPANHGEGLQILHYLPGQQYEPHFDWFDPAQDGYKVITAKGGQRVASVIIYLNAPAAGGGTQFPRAGITISARRGSALYFAYEGGDQSSLHAGLPVTAGEKWIATKWLRECPFA
ncbi:MAG TPA: 2OG-Fe(II) oxygenase [Rhodanobacteraceae bacterium]|nr:2OG-Fe(II) oxygenase [Rhodanobacteraceae bacterium]